MHALRRLQAVRIVNYVRDVSIFAQDGDLFKPVEKHRQEVTPAHLQTRHGIISSLYFVSDFFEFEGGKTENTASKYFNPGPGNSC